MKVIEFKEKYPHYNMGFMANNKPTETEKLLGRMSCLTHDLERKRTYQEFFVKESLFIPLVKFLKEGGPKSFTCNGVEFIGTLRKGDVVAVCLATMERVIFSHGFSIKIIDNEL